MSHDLCVKVMLSAEEFVAFRALCDEEGTSQSGKARQLIKRAISEYAKSTSATAPSSTNETGQE